MKQPLEWHHLSITADSNLLSQRSRNLLALHFLSAPLLRRSASTLGTTDQIPPPEAARVIPNEFLMVHIVVVCAGPEREEMVQRPRELVSGVRINSLKQPQHNPRIHGQDMQIVRDGTPEDGTNDGAKAEKQHLNRTGVLGRQPKRGRVLMVDLVDHLVELGRVERAVRPVVPRVLHDEEDGDLVGHGEQGGEGHGGGETAELGEGVEEPDLRELDGEVGEQHEFGAVPLFGCGGDFVLGLGVSNSLAVARERRIGGGPASHSESCTCSTTGGDRQ
jgi:hypothetical protein